MKYLLVILTIVCTISLASLFLVWPGKQKSTDGAVVTINNTVLTREDLANYKDLSQHHGEREDFINEIITRHLLIAEAQRLNIDKEPAFRTALKTFYEHSLIKTLMERIESEIEVDIADTEIDAYLNSFGSTYTFFTLKTSSPPAPDLIKSQGEKYTSSFEDLGEPLQLALAAIKPGQSTTIFITGNEKIAVYLDRIDKGTSTSQILDRDIAGKMLLESKKEQYINNWIDSLRRQASITFSEGHN